LVTDPDRSERLADELQCLSEESIAVLREVLGDSSPLGEDASRRVRAQITAAGIGLNTQLRADALRLRAVRQDKALERLLALIATKEASTPCDVRPGPTMELGSVASA
jgi:hypothetical protein